jgi:hypothetical protein
VAVVGLVNRPPRDSMYDAQSGQILRVVARRRGAKPVFLGGSQRASIPRPFTYSERACGLATAYNRCRIDLEATTATRVSPLGIASTSRPLCPA